MIDNTFTIISRLQNKMSEMLTAEMEKLGLKNFAPSYGKIFLILKNDEPISMKTIATLIDKTPQTVTTLVANLERQGFVTQKSCQTDKRTKYVIITEKGLEVIPMLEEISYKLYDKQYENFNKDEVESLRKLLLKMLDNFVN